MSKYRYQFNYSRWRPKEKSTSTTMTYPPHWEQVCPHIQIKFKGSFGRVRLTKNKKTGEYFAMKILKKADIIKNKQVDHVISENTILAEIDHPFLV